MHSTLSSVIARIFLPLFIAATIILDEGLLPFYEYFAESIQQHSELQSFRIINYHLPSSWLKESIIPVLENNSNGYDLKDCITTLELSNCSISADDMSALAAFLVKNKTISSLTLARNNIGSVDTVKTLIKAIKNNPMLLDVNLGHCSIGGGDKGVLDKLLVACKDCNSLEIGHGDFGTEGLTVVAKFLSRKMSLTSFSLVSLVYLLP